ncbi:MAG TPA: ribonucleotide-diphosphate reductase subunit beta [Nitrosopumilaceae archaeon]|nr:ribonucleotide-diphosphate reductase subunit beta [Nitrosopumilaceae archaeon]
MYSVILTELGVAVFENQKCLKTFPFLEPVEDYIFVKKGESRLSELAKFLSNIEKGIEVNDHALLAILKKKSINAQLMSEQDSTKIQSTKPKILADAGFAQDEDDAMEKLREFAISLSSSKVSTVSQSPDLHIIQAINSLDETDKIINAMSSRLREWYGLHFPELDNIIDSINGYSQIVLAGKRSNLSKTIYEDAGFPESKVEMLTLVTNKSRGGDISDANLAIVQTIAKQILELFDLRKHLEEHVESEMKKIAPNLSVILGTAVGARILARAGSLKNLAVMPASTIQVLGAEKALFRSLKTGSQPPKHGLLFQHALVHAAPRWQRGKIARAVAGKAAIAARVDFNGGGLNQMLLDKLNIRVVEIEKKYVDAPPPREVRPEPFRERFRSKFNKPKGKKRKRFGRR